MKYTKENILGLEFTVGNWGYKVYEVSGNYAYFKNISRDNKPNEGADYITYTIDTLNSNFNKERTEWKVINQDINNYSIWN